MSEFIPKFKVGDIIRSQIPETPSHEVVDFYLASYSHPMYKLMDLNDYMEGYFSASVVDTVSVLDPVYKVQKRFKEELAELLEQTDDI
jgi:hypothetical protein